MNNDKKYRHLSDQFTIKDVGSTLLNHLAKGLYPADEVIREYVQNAIDAHRLWKREYSTEPEGPIQIEVRGDRLSILDYGIGMFEEEVRRVKSIAVTTKVDTNLSLTGHKGVGIWAGLSYFDTLILETTRRGSDLGYRLTIHFKRIVDSINDRADIGEVMGNNYLIEEYNEEYDEHYTSVTLEKPTRSSDTFTDEHKVRDAIRRICPCEIDPNFVYYKKVMEWYEQHGFETFDIWVEGQPVYRSFPSSVEHFKSLSITVNDVVVAQCWNAINKVSHELKPKNDELIGFRLIQTGFALGGENLYGASKLPNYKPLNQSTLGYLAWHIGEIHLTSDHLRPNLQRDQLEEFEASRQFIQRLRDFYGKIETQGREISAKRLSEAKIEQDTKQTLEKYKRYEEKVTSILSRDVLVTFTSEDDNTLSHIQDDLLKDNQLTEATSDGKKYRHLSDQSVRKLRRKLLDKIEPVLVQIRAEATKVHIVHNEETKDESISSGIYNDLNKGGRPTSVNPDEKISTTNIPGTSNQAENHTSTSPARSMPTSAYQNDVSDEAAVELSEQTLSISLLNLAEQQRSIQDYDVETNGNNQEENVFDSVSRKIPVSVVLGLLEEVLENEFGRDNDSSSVIIARLKEKIDWVLSNV